MERIVDSLPCGLAYTLGMDSPNSETISAPDQQTNALPAKRTNPELLAKLVIRDGKPFNISAIEAGYARTTAGCGLKQLMRESALVANAVRAEVDRAAQRLDTLKPMAVSRLYHEIADYESPYGMKAIELAGRFKETDWFVRNQEFQLGVFVNLAERPDGEQVNDLDKFKE